MKTLKIAASDSAFDCFQTSREVIPLNQTDYTDVAVAVFSVEDVLGDALGVLQRTGFDIPIFSSPPPVPATAPGRFTSTCKMFCCR